MAAWWLLKRVISSIVYITDMAAWWLLKRINSNIVCMTELFVWLPTGM